MTNNQGAYTKIQESYHLRIILLNLIICWAWLLFENALLVNDFLFFISIPEWFELISKWNSKNYKIINED